MRSKKPPHQGARARLNFHDIRLTPKNFWISGSFSNLAICLDAALNVSALSLIISLEIQRRAIKRRKHRRNACADSSGTKSK